MSIFFISDLHLHDSRPDITQRFFQFLQEEAANAKALYILGDFFEVWIGGDILNSHDEEVVQKLAHYAKKIPVYFMQGNRDFLIEQCFAQRMGATLIPDPYLLDLEGERFLLSHGDKLCVFDVPYQHYRAFVHLAWIKKLFLMLPARFRKKIAMGIRNHSQQNKEKRQDKKNRLKQDKQNKEDNYSAKNKDEVCQKAVTDLLKQYHSQILIHGHTHKPGLHEFHYQQQPMKRIVLGEWKTNEAIILKGEIGCTDHTARTDLKLIDLQ